MIIGYATSLSSKPAFPVVSCETKEDKDKTDETITRKAEMQAHKGHQNWAR